MTEVLRDMGSTATRLVVFIGKLGEKVPLAKTALDLLKVIRETVETVEYCREAVEALERRCTNLTAGVIDELKKQQRRSPNSPQLINPNTVEDLEVLIREVDVVVDRCRKHKWWKWALKGDSVKVVIDKLNLRITQQTSELGVAGGVVRGDVHDVGTKVDTASKKVDTASKEVVKEITLHTDRSVGPLVSFSWYSFVARV